MASDLTDRHSQIVGNVNRLYASCAMSSHLVYLLSNVEKRVVDPGPGDQAGRIFADLTQLVSVIVLNDHLPLPAF